MAREQDFNPVPALFMYYACNLFPLGAALSLQSVWARTITGMRSGLHARRQRKMIGNTDALIWLHCAHATIRHPVQR